MFVCVCVHVCDETCTIICRPLLGASDSYKMGAIYIYIYRERERERDAV